MIGTALWATAMAGAPAQTLSQTQTPAPPPGQVPAPAPKAPPASSPDAQAPDDDFIEFLGGDDVGDAAWWEFLKKLPPRRIDPPATPPQDAKQ